MSTRYESRQVSPPQPGPTGIQHSGSGPPRRDKGRGFFNALTAAANGMNGTSNATQGEGFKVWIYTPEEGVCQVSFEAAREYRVLSRDDLPTEDLADVIRVVAYPDTPTEVGAAGMLQQSSAAHVVIRDARKREAIQPIEKRTVIKGGRPLPAALSPRIVTHMLRQLGQSEHAMRVECYGQTRPQEGRQVTQNQDGHVIGRAPFSWAAVFDGAGNAQTVARRAASLLETWLAEALSGRSCATKPSFAG